MIDFFEMTIINDDTTRGRWCVYILLLTEEGHNPV